FKTPLQSMVAAEKGFAKLASEKSVRTAFLANMADNSVIFRPLPVNGLESYRARPETSARLVWDPTYAEIAAAGDFGVTSCPGEFTPPSDQTNAEKAYGTFLSVWRRDADRTWKVELDCGVSHAKPDSGLGLAGFVAGPDHPAAGDTAGLDPTSLRVFD